MIRKIKKYKIAIRPSIVLRNLKRKAGLESVSEEMEKDVRGEIDRAQGMIVPCAVYDSFSKSETPDALKVLWEKSSGTALSLSLALVTIGSRLESEIEQVRGRDEGLRSAILESIARESLDQSLGFVEKLIRSEAEFESCQLTPICPVESNLVKDFLTQLDSQKADVTITSDGQVVPLYTTASYCFWNPLPKGKGTKR